MARISMVACPACGNKISSQAFMCPGCGHAVQAMQVVQQTTTGTATGVQSVQMTGKIFKACMLAGALASIVGIVWAINAPDDNTTAMIIAICGLLVLISARMLAWWSHG